MGAGIGGTGLSVVFEGSKDDDGTGGGTGVSDMSSNTCLRRQARFSSCNSSLADYSIHT